ncbi:MAG: hypothetical protein ACREQ5_21665, partial [Candidatus Dormibacteria bacterium]
MEKTIDHRDDGRNPIRRVPLIASLALAIPLGVGGATPSIATMTVPARTVAAAILAGGPVSLHGAPPRTGEPVPTARALPLRRPAALPAHDAPGAQCNASLATGTLMPFSEHLNHAHFGRSPQQQASDVQDFDTYTKTHTVLVENMTQPGRDDLFTISDGTSTPFFQHMEHAHLERSPQQQTDDAADTSEYVKLHTVLVEHMLE